MKEVRDLSRAAQLTHRGVGEFLEHEQEYAIVGTLSQVQTSDNRDCDSRTAVHKSAVARSTLPSATAAVFARLEALGLKQKDLADHLGIEPNKLSKVKKGERLFRGEELLKAKEFLDRESLSRATVQNVEPDIPPTRSASEGETVAITALDLSLSMGPGTPIEDFVESEPVQFDLGLLRAITRSPFDRLRLVRGIGTSMEPKFQSNDRFLIDTTERQLARLDGYYWINLYGAHGLKRLRPAGKSRVLVISENPDFENQEVDASELSIQGRAVWFSREL